MPRTIGSILLAVGAVPFFAVSLVYDWPVYLTITILLALASYQVAHPRRRARHARQDPS